MLIKVNQFDNSKFGGGNMGVLYESTFFLGIGLLGISIAVYIFAVTLLDKGLRVASKEINEAAEKKKERYDFVMDALKDKLKEAETNNSSEQLVKEFSADIKELRKQDKSFVSRFSSAIQKPNLLTTTSVVTIPGISYLLAIAFSIWGQYSAATDQSHNWFDFWFIVVLLLIGIYFLYKTLRAIEDITIATIKETNKHIS
jgi:hypothetical protein